MSPLFGNRKDKAAQEDAARAEATRLNELTVPAIAAELMPAFGPDGPRPAGIGASAINSLQIANWLMRDYPRGTKYLQELHRPVGEGLQALGNAGLIEWIGSGGPSPGRRWRATRLGEQALTDGGVARYLPSPPTP